MQQRTLSLVACALLGAIGMRFAFNLQPVWWLGWIAPIFVLAPVLLVGRRLAFALIAGAGLITASGSFSYFLQIMPFGAAVAATLAQSGLWLLAMGLARLAMLRLGGAWTVLVYPLIWAAVDCLAARYLPDTNWGSLAYSQLDFLPALQLAAVFGTSGLVFLMCLLTSSLAYVIAFKRGWLALAPAVMLSLAALGFGLARLQEPAPVQTMRFGLAAIDDFIGPKSPPERHERVWAAYERHIAALAGQGARIIVLPEKIAVLSPAEAKVLQQRLSDDAARAKVWLLVGVGIDDGRQRTNMAWLFQPDGALNADYQKRHMAPPEREFVPGNIPGLAKLDGKLIGIAICKDMHFADSFNTSGGQVGAVLVPAWDFGQDGYYAARLSAVRGIEQGFTMVRSAREGLLTISDPYGRVLAEAHSSPGPGTGLLATVPFGAPIKTLQTTLKDCIGWYSVCALFVFLVVGLRREIRSLWR